MTLRDAYLQASQMLCKQGICNADFSARYLLAFTIQRELKHLPLLWDTILSPQQQKRFFRLVRKHARGIPLAYLVGYVDFYGHRFIVRPGVFIPRPDTEHILYAIEKYNQNFTNILDIGTGTGILSISLAFLFPEARITACDISLRALQIAKRNACLLKKHVLFLWNNFLKHPPQGVYDLIVSNPPYIAPEDQHLVDPSTLRYEPQKALFGEKGGLIFYEAIARYSQKHLDPRGKIVVEIDHKWQEIEAIFKTHHLSCHIHYDYQNLPRVLVAEKK